MALTDLMRPRLTGCNRRWSTQAVRHPHDPQQQARPRDCGAPGANRMKVYKAIAAVMAEMAKHGIAKDRRNTQGSGYNFRGIDDV